MRQSSERQIDPSRQRTQITTSASQPETSTLTYSRRCNPCPPPLFQCDSDVQAWSRLQMPSQFSARDVGLCNYMRHGAALGANSNGRPPAPSPMQWADGAPIQSNEGRTGRTDRASGTNEPRLNLADAFQSSATIESVDDWHWIQASTGSAGHPTCCADACKFVRTARGCKDGTRCTRCHLCKWRRHGTKKDSG